MLYALVKKNKGMHSNMCSIFFYETPCIIKHVPYPSLAAVVKRKIDYKTFRGMHLGASKTMTAHSLEFFC